MSEPLSPREFIRTTITSPSHSCQVDLHGFGEPWNETTSAVYLLIDVEQTQSGDWRSAGYGYAKHDSKYRTVHAISRYSRGEVRGYVWSEGKAHVRYPATPAEWPELDALVAEALGAEVLTRCPGCNLPVAGPASGACALGDDCKTGGGHGHV